MDITPSQIINYRQTLYSIMEPHFKEIAEFSPDNTVIQTYHQVVLSTAEFFGNEQVIDKIHFC